MLNKQIFEKILKHPRYSNKAKTGDEVLGPLNLLPGKWANLPGLPGRGWNMIALPFADGPFNYRLLLNQYNEELVFDRLDGRVPNRGLPGIDCHYKEDEQAIPANDPERGDQFIVALDYEQSITQIAQDDFPQSGLAGPSGLPIHHEPGFFLNMVNKTTNDFDIARLGTIPHGNSVLALGKSSQIKGAPVIPDISGLPIGDGGQLGQSKYLEPYQHFHDNLFKNLFDPTMPNELLKEANQGVDIVRTTVLEFDSTLETGGIVNIPFVEKQADAAEMKATFWIQELKECDKNGKPKLRLQYSQIVMLDFFPRRDGLPGLIRWPHVSINTMEKVEEPS